LHYALPLALQRAGILNRVYTDWFVQPGSAEERISRLAQTAVPAARRAADRRCPDLANERVIASRWLALRQRLAMRCAPGSVEARYARCSSMFARWYRRRAGSSANALMGFVRSIDPDLCATARDNGITVVVDQMIAPADVQWRAEQGQEQRWPQWQGSHRAWDVDLVREIEQRTWTAADHVTCPSDYVRAGLLEQGVSADKISVLPYPIDTGAFPFSDRRGRGQSLVVGYIGAVGLRKGAPDVFEVARLFEQRNLPVRFVMVGPGAGELPAVVRPGVNVELTGVLPRSMVRRRLEQFDVFLLPSTCEGSAGSIMEAMATGLPVVTTPSSGSVVRDGIDGFLVPCGDHAGFAQALQRLLEAPELRIRMGESARARVQSFDLNYYAASLHALFGKLLGRNRGQRNKQSARN
jgi:hypothetical protein